MSITESNQSLEARIAVLEDLESLRVLKARYAEFSDLCLRTPSHAHAAALADLFTEDGVGDYGPLGRFEGRAALVNGFEKLLPGGTIWSTHYITNPILTVRGDEADGTWTFYIPAMPKSGTRQQLQTYFGTYEDRYHRTPAGWKIASLKTHFAAPPAA